MRGSATALGLQLCLAAWLACPGAAETAPSFPWTSFQAIAAEHPSGSVFRCDQNDGRTGVAAIFVDHPPEFFRIWFQLSGPDWVAIRFNGEARPDWVWRGTWSGDHLRVGSASAYDPVAHASACDLLFNASPGSPAR